MDINTVGVHAKFVPDLLKVRSIVGVKVLIHRIGAAERAALFGNLEKHLDVWTDLAQTHGLDLDADFLAAGKLTPSGQSDWDYIHDSDTCRDNDPPGRDQPRDAGEAIALAARFKAAFEAWLKTLP